MSGANGEFGDGLHRAEEMSVKPAMMMSVEEASGMVTFVGNQETVSEMRSAWVANIQMV